MSKIILKDINHHNFSNVSIEIEKNKLIVITGPSGSGKSTLAMDIIYAEGQRKFIESLPTYARQFIPLPEKANIGYAKGLTPSIVIDQNTTSNAIRSTVGTISQIYDFIRILYSLIANLVCPECNHNIVMYCSDSLSEFIATTYQNSEIEIIISIKDLVKKKEYEIILQRLVQLGYHEFIINNNTTKIVRKESDFKELISHKDVANIKVIFYSEKKIHDQIQLKKILSDIYSYIGTIPISINKEKQLFSKESKCTFCKHTIEQKPINQKLFSFNLPTGACPHCKGLGETLKTKRDISFDKYYNSFFNKEANNNTKKTELEEKTDIYYETCPACKGGRLNKFALSLCINNKNIVSFCSIQINNYHSELEKILLLNHPKKSAILSVVNEIERRLSILNNLGLGYLTLVRNSNTLSGGELQRIRLAGQLGSGLSGITYILDEPSIGLHQSDNTKLITTMKDLRNIGNTVIVVEHDDETMLAADLVIDIGPGAGIHGGKVQFIGTPEKLKMEKNSITADYLSGKKTLDRSIPRKTPMHFFEIKNASSHNLKNITVKIPLKGIMTVISGLSGSGKSTLIFDEFIPQYTNENNDKKEDILIIDQKPIGRTMRSTIGTYFGFFDDIRDIYANLPESKILGLTKGSFSFNTGEFRCKTCSGRGTLTIDMEPLPTTTVLCEICQGKRYQNIILNITYKNKNIFEVLEMNVEEAFSFFEFHRKIKRQLESLVQVGLSYITLNQGSDTFSGGESQRIKLAYELSRKLHTSIYILDEPTTGLHFQDISLLLKIFDNLLAKGSTIIVIEHNLAIIRYADHIIDMGPLGGNEGGYVIAEGSPSEIKNNLKSITGKYL